MRLLQKSKLLEYKWKDVVFYIRSQATAGDKHEMVVKMTRESEIDKDGKITGKRSDNFPFIIERFVEKWEGVTYENGIAIPWSIENLYKLPADPKEDIVILLGSYIFNHTGLAPVDEGKKKD